MLACCGTGEGFNPPHPGKQLCIWALCGAPSPQPHRHPPVEKRLVKAFRLTEGGVGWLGVPANIGLLLTAPADRPLRAGGGAGAGAWWELQRSR